MRAELLQRLLRHPSWDAALDGVSKHQHIALYDMAPSQRLLSALALSDARPVICLMPS